MAYDITITLIDDQMYVEPALHMLQQYSCFAFDLEGVNLGRHGQITMLQIASAPTHVYCFDVLKLGPTLFVLIKSFLEDATKIKLCYDARCDADALYHSHGICLRGIMDIQVMYTVIHQHPTDPYLKGLTYTLALPGIVEPQFLQGVLACKIAGKNSMKTQGTRLFTNRPLPLQLLRYCTLDVVYLFAMYVRWARLCDVSVVMHISACRCAEYVNSHNSAIKKRIMSVVDFAV